jgi:hypothetical protein
MIPIKNIRTKEDNEHNIIHVQCDISLEDLNEDNFDVNVVKECLAKYKTGSIYLNINLGATTE